MSPTRNFGPLDQMSFTDKQLMREIGLMARERIVRRTRSGQGVDAPFQSYSSEYAVLKAKVLGAGTVNLTVSGRMLNEIVITDVTDTTVELGFSS